MWEEGLTGRGQTVRVRARGWVSSKTQIRDASGCSTLSVRNGAPLRPPPICPSVQNAQLNQPSPPSPVGIRVTGSLSLQHPASSTTVVPAPQKAVQGLLCCPQPWVQFVRLSVERQSLTRRCEMHPSDFF